MRSSAPSPCAPVACSAVAVASSRPPTPDQHAAPEQVEIDPAPAQQREPDPLEHRPGGQPHHREHRRRVGAQREQPGAGRQQQQHRGQHQPRAVRRGHQERPQHQVVEAGHHADAEAVAIAAREPPRAEADQAGRRRHLQHRDVHELAQQLDARNDDGDRGEVAERDRGERAEYRCPPARLQPAADREQPAHRRVDAVERAETGQGGPGPELRGRRCVRHSNRSRTRRHRPPAAPDAGAGRRRTQGRTPCRS